MMSMRSDGGRSVLTLVLLAAAWATAASCGPRDGETTAPPEPQAAALVAVRTVVVQPRDLRETLDYVGTVRFRDESKVSARVGGTLAEQLVPEGAQVAAGQAVARVEMPELGARLRGVAAELERLEALRAQACTVSATDGALAGQQALPQAKADASAASCAAARHGVDAARAKRDELRLSVGYTNPSASAQALVLRWLAEPGEAVAPGRPLVLLGSGAKELEAGVTVADLLRGIRVGQTVRVAAPGGTRADSEVLRVAPMASGAGRHVAVRVGLAPELGGLPVGAAVDLRFVVQEERGAAAVPIRAVLHAAGGQPTIFVVEDGRAARRVVSTGISEGGWVAVTAGLALGAEVVTTNLGMLSDGAAVMAVREPAASPQAEALP